VPPLAAVPDLQHELDQLYAKPLDEFTKARNDLAARLRKAHQAEAAAHVRGLKKPSVVAWAANHVARSHPDLVSVLLEAGARLRDVQQRSLAGNATQSEVADATSRERDAVRALVTAARSDLGSRATAPLLDRLSQTFRAAAVDPALAPVLATGRLTEELQAVGFGPLEAVTPKRRGPSIDEKRAERDRLKELRAEARRLAQEAKDALRAAHDAERQADELRRAADQAREAADRAATALAEAERP
jgi:vacuolar-type H+-ATPase subunit I/STV1